MALSKKELAHCLVDTCQSFETESDALHALEAVTQCIEYNLLQGHDVSLLSLGKLVIKDRAARKGRNPSTGEVIDIPASRAITFKVSSTLKKQLNDK